MLVSSTGSVSAIIAVAAAVLVCELTNDSTDWVPGVDHTAVI